MRGAPVMGETLVDAPIMCTLTRFGLRSPRHLLPMLRDNRRLLSALEEPERFGLLQSAFLVESPTACVSLSVWDGKPIMSGNAPEHVDVARRAFGRLTLDQSRGPELWSTTWRLVSVSNNLNWGDLDLRAAIARHEEVAA